MALLSPTERTHDAVPPSSHILRQPDGGFSPLLAFLLRRFAHAGAAESSRAGLFRQPTLAPVQLAERVVSKTRFILDV